MIECIRGLVKFCPRCAWRDWNIIIFLYISYNAVVMTKWGNGGWVLIVISRDFASFIVKIGWRAINVDLVICMKSFFRGGGKVCHQLGYLRCQAGSCLIQGFILEKSWVNVGNKSFVILNRYIEVVGHVRGNLTAVEIVYSVV